MKLTIYIIPEKGNGVPVLWKELEVETGTLNIPAYLFSKDINIELEFTHNAEA